MVWRLQERSWRMGWRCERPAHPLRRVRQPDYGEDAYHVGESLFLRLLSGELHVLALLPVELRRTAERHPRQRRAGTRQLDKRHPPARQPALWRPKQTARRAEAEQRAQRVLLSAARVGSYRPLLASFPRTARHPAVLGGVLPVLHDGACHCALPQPDAPSAS